jgi:hypothetical protein
MSFRGTKPVRRVSAPYRGSRAHRYTSPRLAVVAQSEECAEETASVCGADRHALSVEQFAQTTVVRPSTLGGADEIWQAVS